MPLTKEHKQKSRQKMLESAMALFSRQGFDRVSINDVMQHAGLTRGAFYAHFESKEDLYAQAISNWPKQSSIVKEYFKGIRGQQFIDKAIDGYLSPDHLNRAIPCPLAFLVTDVANNNEKIREMYTDVYNKLVNVMNKESTLSENKKNDDLMLAVTAMMVGGVAVGRALIDPDLTDRLLESCRSVAHLLVESEA